MEQVSFCQIVIAFILFGGGFGQLVSIRRGLLLLVVELPQFAGDRGFFAALDGQAVPVPLCPSVK
nr:MAG TPA: hypothetical protein [Caudoviricetes sp.]